MDNKIRIVNKKIGQTPLDCINEIKKNELDLLYLPLTYAGRLDPLAEGVLVILIGDECLKKDEYLKLPKEYEVEVLFGFSTDTYDVMGKVINLITSSSVPTIRNILPKFTGQIKQSYPPYSSRTVNGKPLFQWSREGKIDDITVPFHDVFVEKIEILKEDFILGDELLNRIKKDISQVGGDFRQPEIITIWEHVLKEKKKEKYKTITLRISCGSGFYVRALAHDIGIAIGVPALALRIKRTKVGDYGVN